MVGSYFIHSLLLVMNKSIKLIFLFLLAIGLVYPQTTDKNNLQFSDSIKITSKISPLSILQNKYKEFEIYRNLNSMKMNVDVNGDPKTLWLRTSLVISNTNNPNTEFKPNFLSPLAQKYKQDSKFNPIKYVLGAAQVGAVGYLAYKHIKKYGFLK